MAAAHHGTLTEKSLTALIAEAAQQQTINAYRADLRRRIEPLFTQAFHNSLKNGCADELIEAMRPLWDEHVEAVAAARAVIPAESSTDHFLASTQDPNAIQMWQQLSSHIARIDNIGRIAAQFGCRTGSFPQVKEFANAADGHLLEDRAIMATDGPLVADSAAFRRPDQGHRTSPWFKLPLKLHSMASAQARYDSWASDQFDRIHSGPMESWIDEKGIAHQKPRPENPFKKKESVT